MKNFSEIKFVPKGWGYEKWTVNKAEYCGKILFFVKGKKCSWHYHKIKDEVFYINRGKLIVSYSPDDDLSKATQVILEEGDNFYVKVGMRHQMKALQDTQMFEFSTQHFDSDSHRIQKGD